MSAHDQTSPAALHALITRLLDDHERMMPHHADLCPLCKDTRLALELLADELPDDGDAGEPGAPRSDSERIAMLEFALGARRQEGERLKRRVRELEAALCEVGRGAQPDTPALKAVPACGAGAPFASQFESRAFRCPTCCTASEQHADTCPSKNGECPGCWAPRGQPHYPNCPEQAAGRSSQ